MMPPQNDLKKRKYEVALRCNPDFYLVKALKIAGVIDREATVYIWPSCWMVENTERKKNTYIGYINTMYAVYQSTGCQKHT